MNVANLLPAYGRDYKTQAAILADFDAERDFILTVGASSRGVYINKQQFPETDFTHVRFTYDNRRKTFLHELSRG